ncbi:SurA N-terminal domain-containing protein [Streptomyces sp. NBC_01089]|uniref:SurA N-terminal domain-containing protein n=1 Tax=Streptomyces sp. NBC_01089 TaxID=2903747 RepID=UPI003868BD43|nr:SurA N-terminal domain-containing protein [Streptomyces sp. NBC_01089]
MHRRRRTALSVSVALVAAAPLLAACGSQPHPGAAAVVGKDRITVAALQTQVNDVRAAQNKSPQAAELIKSSNNLSGMKLGTMIFDRVLAKAASDAGAKVTRKDVQDARAQLVKQAGSEQRLQQVYLQQNGIAPGQIDQALQEQVTASKLAAKLGGASLSTPQGQSAVLQAMMKTSRAMGVDVNPRYGVWDAKKSQLGAYKTPWITEVTKEQTAQSAGTGVSAAG